MYAQSVSVKLTQPGLTDIICIQFVFVCFTEFKNNIFIFSLNGVAMAVTVLCS